MDDVARADAVPGAVAGYDDQPAVLRDVLGPALGRDPADLVHLPVGPPEHCARVLADYAAAGARRVLLWPLCDGIRQLRRCAEEVAPHLAR